MKKINIVSALLPAMNSFKSGVWIRLAFHFPLQNKRPAKCEWTNFIQELKQKYKKCQMEKLSSAWLGPHVASYLWNKQRIFGKMEQNRGHWQLSACLIRWELCLLAANVTGRVKLCAGSTHAQQCFIAVATMISSYFLTMLRPAYISLKERVRSVLITGKT